MNLNVISSVFKRNFTGYLSNPTGYVFIFAITMGIWADEQRQGTDELLLT